MIGTLSWTAWSRGSKPKSEVYWIHWRQWDEVAVDRPEVTPFCTVACARLKSRMKESTEGDGRA